MTKHNFPAGGSISHLVHDDTMLDSLGPIGLITAQIESGFAERINHQLRLRRQAYAKAHPHVLNTPGYVRQNYLIDVDLSRFMSGEGKAVIRNTVRGHDLYILTDVLNYGQTYRRYNRDVTLSPDEHYKDLTRLILSSRDSAGRINVIMPYLYQGRRFRKSQRESLDCGEMLRHLFGLGIDNFITFDAHDSRVANAVPYSNFESFPTSHQFIRTLLRTVPDLVVEPTDLMIVAPDEVNINRCIFYASTMRVPLGIFYSKHSFRYVGNELYRETARSFLGESVEGKDIIMISDLLDNGEGCIECASHLKARGARRVFSFTTFAQFTHGISAMRQAWESGIVERIFATDMSYRPPELISSPWYTDVPMADDLALLINALNHDASLSRLMAPAERISRLLAEHHERRLLGAEAEDTYDGKQISFADL